MAINENAKMSTTFTAKKAKIVQQLSTSDEDYTDSSPIGKVDENIRNLVDVINTLDSLVTTSSCSGRIAIYLEGRKKGQAHQEAISDNVSNPSAGAGGKGGGQWLFVSHDPLEEDHDLLSSCAFAGQSQSTTLASTQNVRWIRCKFEPMVGAFQSFLAISKQNAFFVSEGNCCIDVLTQWTRSCTFFAPRLKVPNAYKAQLSNLDFEKAASQAFRLHKMNLLLWLPSAPLD